MSGLDVKKGESLKEHNTLKVGGKAKMLLEVRSKEDMRDAIELAKKNKMPYLILGGGTNVLISDKGFEGVVIKNKIDYVNIQKDKECIEAGSGVSMGALLTKAKSAGLSGLEWAAGLPGTLGGAIFGNAGSCGGEMKDNVDYIEVLDTDTMTFKCLLGEECDFAYRHSIFHNNVKYVITGAMLKFKKRDPVEIMNEMAENMLFRQKHQPLAARSEGCMFKNIDLSQRKDVPLDLWKEIPEFSLFVRKGVVPAGFLIDRAGLKGLQVGTAKVSDRHANFIVSEKDANSEDIHNLILEIKKKVKEKFQVELEEEVRLVGFNKD